MPWPGSLPSANSSSGAVWEISPPQASRCIPAMLGLMPKPNSPCPTDEWLITKPAPAGRFYRESKSPGNARYLAPPVPQSIRLGPVWFRQRGPVRRITSMDALQSLKRLGPVEESLSSKEAVISVPSHTTILDWTKFPASTNRGSDQSHNTPG